jgi:hypothetical protein
VAAAAAAACPLLLWKVAPQSLLLHVLRVLLLVLLQQC